MASKKSVANKRCAIKFSTNNLILAMKRYIYKKQHENRGYYAEIIFEVQFDEGDSDELQINYLALPNWELMCRAGLNLFYKYFIKYKSGKIMVTIHEIKWRSVDTNHLIVMFVSVKALCDALNYEIENLKFDSSTQTFNFPDFHSV
jgi:hypothetical protein